MVLFELPLNQAQIIPMRRSAALCTRGMKNLDFLAGKHQLGKYENDSIIWLCHIRLLGQRADKITVCRLQHLNSSNDNGFGLAHNVSFLFICKFYLYSRLANMAQKS